MPNCVKDHKEKVNLNDIFKSYSFCDIAITEQNIDAQ